MASTPELKIDQNNLSMEMAMQASNYLYVAEQAVKAEAVYDTTEYSHDVTVAEVDGEIRTKAAAEGRKITEKQIEAEVTLNDKVRLSAVRMIKAKAEKGMLRAHREAWFSRKDMLIQMAIKERNEIDAITGTRVVGVNA